VAVPASAAPSASPPPAGFFGMQSWTDATARDLERMRRADVRVLRANISWSVVEPRPGVRDWDRYDELFRRAARAGIELVPVLVGSPGFAASHVQYPPRREHWQGFAAFVADAVGRYGRGGDLWAGGGVRPRPPRAWQVWNEPNLSNWWGSRPDPREYAALLRVAHRAIEARDRRALVVLAGMPATAQDVQGPDYLRSLYRVRGVRALFDVVAVHPYARDATGALEVVARTRRAMRGAGDGRAPIWVTEFGWGSRDGAVPPELSASERGQARLLSSTLGGFVANRRRYGIEKAFWFSWRDRAPARGEGDWWALHTGLFRRDGTAKPSWRSFRRLTARP
jgi:hypothetical protein